MRSVLWFALGIAITSLGCRPKIGDDCQLGTDCSEAGDLLCDVTQPGGYCTSYNCDSGGCPDEAVCIGFASVISSVPGDDSRTSWACVDPQESSRFQRNFCMRSCDSNSDCRAHYRCLDLGAPGNDFGAVLVESSRKKNGKVCVVPTTEPLPASDSESIPGVCEGNFATGPVVAEGGAPTSGGAAAGGAQAGSGQAGASQAGASQAGNGQAGGGGAIGRAGAGGAAGSAGG